MQKRNAFDLFLSFGVIELMKKHIGTDKKHCTFYWLEVQDWMRRRCLVSRISMFSCSLCCRMINYNLPLCTTLLFHIHACLPAVWTDEIKHGEANKETKVERKWKCSMEKSTPTQLSGPAPSLPVATKHWFPDLIFCLLLLPSSLHQHFLMYKT